MDITVLDVIDEVRGSVKDTGATGSYKWSNQDIIDKINQTLEMAFNKRPDLFMVEDVVYESPQVALEGDTVAMVSGRAALVAGTAAFLLLENAGDEFSRAAADAQMGRFNATMGA